MANQSSRTTPRAFRITLAQDSFLDQPQYKTKASAIVRALLTLYLEGRLCIEGAIEEDLREIEIRKVMRRV